MEESTIFYAWQSDTADGVNRYFIRDALKKALKQLERDDLVEECPRLDHDTKDVPGTPPIAETILKKIEKATIFIADVTLIGKVGDKHVLNPNVAIELGFALKAVMDGRIILVMNTAFADPDKLPFDLRHRRHPLTYELAHDASKEEVASAKANLANALAEAIRLILKAPIKKPSARKLTVGISPTHNGKRQLAFVRLFNGGPGPVFVESCWLQWGPDGRKGATNTVSTFKGRLPVRIEEQNVAELIIEVGDDVEELSGIGVFDGEHNLWLADEGMLEAFKHQAITHRLPPLPTSDKPPQKSAVDCSVEIETRALPPLTGSRLRLEVRFKNNSDVPIPVTGARLSWTYTPPRKAPTQAGNPIVAEAGGSVGLTPQFKTSPVNPGQEVFFILDDSFAVLLVELLRGDVRDEDIKIDIVTSKGIGWTGAMDEIPGAVRAVAQSVLESLHRAKG